MPLSHTGVMPAGNWAVIWTRRIHGSVRMVGIFAYHAPSLVTLEPGTRVGPYEVVAPIGSGGMGEVFRARDGRLKRDVALKLLRPSAVGDADRLPRFQREAQVLASISHPAIAQIFGIERHGDAPVSVMEFVDGPTLAERLKRGALSIDDALSIATQLCDGLEAAHERSVIHRDLKPANIKVRPDGT